jgi:hypothetical protein
VDVGINTVDEVYEGWRVAVELVAWSGPDFEDLAGSGAEEGRNDGGVFVADEARSCTKELVFR